MWTLAVCCNEQMGGVTRSLYMSGTSKMVLSPLIQTVATTCFRFQTIVGLISAPLHLKSSWTLNLQHQTEIHYQPYSCRPVANQYVEKSPKMLSPGTQIYQATSYPRKLWNLQNCSPLGDQASCIKIKALEIFWCEHKEQKQFLKTTTSSNVSTLRALLKLRLVLLMQRWSCLLLRTFVLNF